MRSRLIALGASICLAGDRPGGPGPRGRSVGRQRRRLQASNTSDTSQSGGQS